ncbi:peptidase M48 [Ruegeria sediminis]|uniref:Peptidase M48 n=1 Tax=Ruegeria sediminis TaxID=2583820 RepID=A0ABY2X496_9RHOB|nr:M48 family metalloprotease [Ruegeria sediminis]TMV09789.1 peptidase M48 [Ruegeria sediminis]
MRRIALLLVLVLSACEVTAPPPATVPAPQSSALPPNTRVAAKNFDAVSQAVGAQARAECKRRTSGGNCDFRILIDPDKRAPANAYQTLDKQGRPVIVFTQSMIASTRNGDELAFVMGHEAAHHIRGHIARQSQNAAVGAIVFGQLAGLTGGNAAAIDAAQQLGAVVGARSYSKEFELEADQLGTIITYNAGYNPLVGVLFFDRVPDPGNRFLGSHPPNAQRVQAVNQTARQLGLIR